MNAAAMSLLLVLGRTTLVLAIAAVAVRTVLGLARPTSPTVHRVAWCLVVLLGWSWFRVPIAIPYFEPPARQLSDRVSDRVPEGLSDRVPERVPERAAEGVPLLRRSSAEPAALPSTASEPTTAHALTGARASRPLSVESAEHVVSADTPIAAEQGHESATGVASYREPAENAVSAERAGRPRSNEATSFEIILAYWPAAVALGWLVGILWILGQWLVGYRGFLRSFPTPQPAPAEWLDQWQTLLAKHGVRHAIPMTITTNLGPTLCRLPRGYQLYVPAELWRRLTPAGRMSILRHELAHCRRGDVWKSLLLRLIALPHWFNPLAWWAVHKFEECAEWACDGQAIEAAATGAADYAQALLELHQCAHPNVAHQPAAWGRGLSLRIRRLLTASPTEDSLMKKSLVLGVALALTLLCLVRVDLVAKNSDEPAAAPPAAAAEKPASPVVPASAAAAQKPAPAIPPAETAVGEMAGPKKTTAAKDGAGVPKQYLCYSGKTFKQWCYELKTELNPAQRVQAIQAFVAFGAHGFGKEAAEAVVELAREYDFKIIDGSPIGRLKEAALSAFREPSGSNERIDPEFALPVLLAELKNGKRFGRLFAAHALGEIGSAGKDATAPLLQYADADPDAEIREVALYSALRLDARDGRTAVALLQKALHENDAKQFEKVLSVLPLTINGYDHTGYGNGMVITMKLTVQGQAVWGVLIDAVKHKDATIRNAAYRAMGGGSSGAYPGRDGWSTNPPGAELRKRLKETAPVLLQAFEKADLGERRAIFSVLRPILSGRGLWIAITEGGFVPGPKGERVTQEALEPAVDRMLASDKAAKIVRDLIESELKKGDAPQAPAPQYGEPAYGPSNARRP